MPTRDLRVREWDGGEILLSSKRIQSFHGEGDVDACKKLGLPCKTTQLARPAKSSPNPIQSNPLTMFV
jgi:hypothetical protein